MESCQFMWISMNSFNEYFFVFFLIQMLSFSQSRNTEKKLEKVQIFFLEKLKKKKWKNYNTSGVHPSERLTSLGIITVQLRAPWNTSNTTAGWNEGLKRGPELERRSLYSWITCTVHTEKYFRNFIKLNRNQIIFTYHFLIDSEQQTDVRLVLNQPVNGKYNLISVWFNNISKYFSVCTPCL